MNTVKIVSEFEKNLRILERGDFMMNRKLLYIGTYTEDIKFGTGQILEAKGEGVYLYRLNQEDGSLEYLNVFSGIRNPSYLTFSPCNRYMYAVNELKEFEGKPSGSVSAFSVDRESGEIEFINSLPTRGTDPCYVSTDDTGLLYL